MLTRRDSLKLTLALAASARMGLFSRAQAEPTPVFKVPPLGYGYDALEPYIDAKTKTIHHGRHHGAFVTALNWLVEKYPDLAAKSPAAILSNLAVVPKAVRVPVRNYLGGHWNPSFFWEIMTPGGAKEPGGDLKSAIDSAFRSTAKLIEKVNAAGLARFGSGWAWLVVDQNGKLDIVSTPNQDTPLPLAFSESCSGSMSGSTPIISNICTTVPIISRPGGILSIGTRRRRISPRRPPNRVADHRGTIFFLCRRDLVECASLGFGLAQPFVQRRRKWKTPASVTWLPAVRRYP